MLGQRGRRGAAPARRSASRSSRPRTRRAWAAPTRWPTPPAWRRRCSPRARRTRGRRRSCSSTRTTGGPASRPRSSPRRRCARPCCSPRAASCPRRRADALDKLQPTGAKEAGGAQVIRIGDVAEPDGLKATDIPAATRRRPRAAIDKLQAAAPASRTQRRARRLRRPARTSRCPPPAGRRSPATRCCGPAATRCRPRRAAAIKAHGKPRDLRARARRRDLRAASSSELRKLGSVKRVSGPDPGRPTRSRSRASRTGASAGA